MYLKLGLRLLMSDSQLDHIERYYLREKFSRRDLTKSQGITLNQNNRWISI